MVIDVTTFRLAAGASTRTTSWRRTAAGRPSWCRTVSGFVRRTTARRGGEWVVITLWASEADAAAFEADTAAHEVRRVFDEHVAAESRRALRYDTLD